MDGDYYDRCPADGCMVVDAAHRSEGTGHGRSVEQYHDWSIFSADVRQGGCGASWTRTTSTGLEKDHAHGRESVNLTAGAGKGRFTSVPSDAFRDRYALAFGHE